MTLSRKDFFRRGLFSIGDALLSVGETLREAQSSLYGAAAPAPEGGPGTALSADPATGARPLAGAATALSPLEGRGVRVEAPAHTGAPVDNRHCMAKNCGCFSCLERCEAGAISLVLGEGIAIDAQLCTGCGDCCDICPLAPQALALVARG